MYYVLAVSSPLTKTLANTIYIYGAYPGAVGMLQKHIYKYGAYPGAVGAQKPIYIYTAHIPAQERVMQVFILLVSFFTGSG